jgi:hypothetical protein
MSAELDQLKHLVFDLDYDADSRQEVAQLEVRLAEVARAERIAALPTISTFIEYLSFQKEAAEHRLLTDRDLTDRDRDRMFERIDLTTRFISLFNGEERQAVEQNINQLLDVAKAS